MAGAGGFEPTNDGTKTRCLASLATPLHFTITPLYAVAIVLLAHNSKIFKFVNLKLYAYSFKVLPKGLNKLPRG